MSCFRLFFVCLFLVRLTATYAQPATPPPPSPEKPYIEVTGTAVREVVPDEIYIRISLKERERLTILQQEEKMKNAIREAGIDMNNLSVADANAAYVRVGWQSKDFVNRKDYILKVSTASEVKRVFQHLSDASVNEAEIDRVSHSQIETIRKEVRIQAMKAAKEKADYLLAAVGETTGKPVEIRELDATANSLLVANRAYNAGKSGFFEKELEFHAFEVQFSIYARFLIK